MPSALLVAGLVVVSTVLHTFAIRGVEAPQILCDEFIHAGIVDSIVRHGDYAYRGEPLRYSFTYPLALAPAWSVGWMHATFELTKATNALLLSSAAARSSSGLGDSSRATRTSSCFPCSCSPRS